MSWAGNSPLKKFDVQLAKKAGISTNRRAVVQFFHPETYKMLLTIEALSARDKGHTNPREFLKTIFGVRSKGSGYEYYVMEQHFRPDPTL